MIIAITPNGETWTNAVVIPFPAAFNFDDRYGARWQAEIEQAMTDPLWQAPHTPCGLGASDTWNMDDGTCRVPAANAGGGTDYYYAHAPFVEARSTLPAGAPALPAGITLGYTAPIFAGGLTPPGMIGFDPGSGNPVGAWTIWGYRLNIEEHACAGSCQFNYVDAENLACIAVNYSAPTVPADPALSGLGGLT
jgi:hypothetical protein